MIDRLLRNYKNAGMIVQLKARFLLYLLLIIIIFIPFIILYSVNSHLNNPALNYTISWPGIIPMILLFISMICTLFLLYRGNFILSSHLTTIIVFASIWTVIFIDKSEHIMKLDTTLIVLGFSSALPILILNKKYMALLYGIVNTLILYVFMYYSWDTLGLPGPVIAEYLSENTVALLFSSIVAYNILSINTRALDQAETSNFELQRTNMELHAATEELTASNEEFEAQNEELIRSEEALRESEADLLAIFNSVHDAMIVYDLNGAILDVNQPMLEMFRLDRRQALSHTITDLSNVTYDNNATRKLWMKVVGGREALFEWEVRRPGDGTIFTSEVGLRALKRRGNTVLLAVVRDITQRKEAEKALNESLQEKIVLIREIHHRVKNNMQVISSLLNMQADSVAQPDANQALKDAVGRIHSMASIHEKIYSTENFSKVDMSSYIEELSSDLAALHSGNDRNVQINHRMESVFLGVDLAIPCGLLINEILTNAIKHGRGEAGNCVIDLTLEESGGITTLVIADKGPGMPPELFETQRKTSMGMQIIDALARQIGATVDLTVEKGTRFTIRFPSA
ncbi:MAG: PAS domain S-box protein [Spirochaetes bacterium]|nr:PAS domain S-box protein [Spirochaetota bacterium]